MLHGRLIRVLASLMVLTLFVTACGVGVAVSPSPEESKRSEMTKEVEHHWNQLLGRDSIRPIYEPEFVPADEAGYDDDELVMGVELEGEAHAYPVGLLNRREMVNDWLAGTPILVTW